MKPWNPRSSAVGAYISCDFRAAFDRAIAEGLLPSQPEGPKAYADFGTICHYELMTRMNLEFPDGKEAPTAEQYTAASMLFSDDPDRMVQRAKDVARFAEPHVPKPPEGATWLAETGYKLPDLSGHIDFISSDGSVIGDLKTTSRKPEHGKAKATHLWQLLCYAELAQSSGAEPKSAWILYVGSLKDWALRIDFDLTTPEMMTLRRHLRKYISYLRGPTLYDAAMPRPGHHCEGDFCPHRARCRDRFFPASGEATDAPAAPTVTFKANPFA